MTDTPRPASLHVYIGYRDAPAAMGWLETAFGFETTMQWPDESGGIQHAEMRRGDAAFVVFSGDYDRPAMQGETSGRGFYITLPDEAAVDAVFASARGGRPRDLGSAGHRVGQLPLPRPRRRGLRVDLRHAQARGAAGLVSPILSVVGITVPTMDSPNASPIRSTRTTPGNVTRSAATAGPCRR